MVSPRPSLSQLSDIRKRTSLKPYKSALLQKFARNLKTKLSASRSTSKCLNSQYREINTEIAQSRWDHADQLVALQQLNAEKDKFGIQKERLTKLVAKAKSMRTLQVCKPPPENEERLEPKNYRAELLSLARQRTVEDESQFQKNDGVARICTDQ